MFRRISPHAGKKVRNYRDLLDITMAYILRLEYKVTAILLRSVPSDLVEI